MGLLSLERKSSAGKSLSLLHMKNLPLKAKCLQDLKLQPANLKRRDTLAPMQKGATPLLIALNGCSKDKVLYLQ